MTLPKGYTGLQFPFRFTGTGAVASSTTTVDDISHIKEEILQALQVYQGEQVLEPTRGSKLNSIVFEPGDETTEAYVIAYAKEALEPLLDRIDVTDIRTEWANETTLNIYLTIYIKKFYMSDTVVVPYKLGGEF